MAIASRMFARWCQENFFAYMMQHFDIDGLIEYGAESIPGTLSIINPTWHNLDKAIKKTRQLERKLQAKLAEQTLGMAMKFRKKPNVSKLSRPCRRNFSDFVPSVSRHPEK